MRARNPGSGCSRIQAKLMRIPTSPPTAHRARARWELVVTLLCCSWSGICTFPDGSSCTPDWMSPSPGSCWELGTGLSLAQGHDLHLHWEQSPASPDVLCTCRDFTHCSRTLVQALQGCGDQGCDDTNLTRSLLLPQHRPGTLQGLKAVEAERRKCSSDLLNER